MKSKEAIKVVFAISCFCFLLFGCNAVGDASHLRRSADVQRPILAGVLSTQSPRANSDLSEKNVREAIALKTAEAATAKSTNEPEGSSAEGSAASTDLTPTDDGISTEMQDEMDNTQVSEDDTRSADDAKADGDAKSAAQKKSQKDKENANGNRTSNAERDKVDRGGSQEKGAEQSSSQVETSSPVPEENSSSTQAETSQPTKPQTSASEYADTSTFPSSEETEDPPVSASDENEEASEESTAEQPYWYAVRISDAEFVFSVWEEAIDWAQKEYQKRLDDEPGNLMELGNWYGYRGGVGVYQGFDCYVIEFYE